MALIIPVGFGQAVYEMRLTGDSEPIVVTMGHDLDNALGDYEDAASVLYQYFTSYMCFELSNQYTVTAVSLYVGQDGGPPALFEFAPSSPVVGPSTGTPLPQNCAVLVRKRTSSAGRRGRGRIYMPGIAESEVNPAGVIGTTTRNNWQTAAENWFEACRDGADTFVAYPMVVLHRSEGAGVEPPPTVITALEVDTVIATQRRRLRK
jgi:hypothetical protein